MYVNTCHAERRKIKKEATLMLSYNLLGGGGGVDQIRQQEKYKGLF
jgi:hypothetical protein